MMSMCDFGLRRAFAEDALEEPATAFWIEHYPECAANRGDPCGCGLIVWFWNGRMAVSIDATLAESLQPMQ